MSYSKNSWSTGDTITATKLNHLEDGVYNTDAAATAAGPLLVPFTAEIDDQGNITLSTEADYATTRAAALAGRTVIANVTVADMTTRFPLWGDQRHGSVLLRRDHAGFRRDRGDVPEHLLERRDGAVPVEVHPICNVMR